MIRDMRVCDASRVHALMVGPLGYDLSEEVVRGRIADVVGDERCVSLVHVDDETDVVDGFIHAMRYETLTRPGVWDVLSLAVDPSFQCRGIGSELLGHAERCVRERGGLSVCLGSRMERAEAHAFYAARGYVCEKVQKRFSKRLG